MKMLNKYVSAFLAILGLFAVTVTASHAALPAVIGTTLTAVQTDALALIDLVWPVVGAVAGGFILFKLFKRGASKI